MIKLEIDNSYSRITGLSAAQEKKLKAALSYTIGGSAAFFSGFGPRRKSLLDKKGYFPTGLMHRIAPVLSYIPMTRLDRRKIPDINFIIGKTAKTAYRWQLNALDAASKHNRGIITAPTGTGKSRTMLLLVESYQLKTLIVVPSLEIKKQLSDTFAGQANVTIENIDSPTLESHVNFDMLIIDEAHHVAAKTYQQLNKKSWTKIYRRYFFTATPFRNDTEELYLFESIAGSIIYQLDYKTAIKEKYIVPIEAYYVDIPKQPTKAYSYQEVYSDLVVNNTLRNLITSTILLNLQKSGSSTLCLVREVKHGQILAELTGLPFVSGADEASRQYIRQFNDGGLKVLIGTTGILGEGIDSKPCEYVVIAGGGKAKSQFMQQVGRALRNYPGKTSAKVILIRDTSHKYLLKHFNAQRKILLDDYGVKSLKLDI